MLNQIKAQILFQKKKKKTLRNVHVHISFNRYYS